LSNDQVARVLPKLADHPYLIVTEHVPAGDFPPNHDKAAGPHTRLQSGSGLMLDAAPFNLQRQKRVLCRVNDRGTIIETTLWS
jgi:hypothetical protein